MGNTVSAHICHIKVFRPYPVIFGVLGGKATGVLGGKATVLVCMHDKFPI